MSKYPRPVVIVGGGAAGHAAATTLRGEGFDGQVVLFERGPYEAYNRTLVTKGVLPGLLSPGQIALPDLRLLDVEVRTARVRDLDTDAQTLVLADGTLQPYEALIVASGARPRTHASAAGGRVTHVHTIEDAHRVRTLLGPTPQARRVLVLGAGFVGTEMASHLADMGVEVHLVARSTLPMAAALGSAAAERLRDAHAARTRTYFGRTVTSLSSQSESVTGYLDASADAVTADFAVLAHGTTPDAGWTGSPHGVEVDTHLRARGAVGVYAAGSVARHRPTNGHRHTADHWDGALAQGAHAARVLLHDLTGATDPGPYRAATGFRLSAHGIHIAGFGTSSPGATERQHRPSGHADVLTTFHTETGDMTAVVGIGAARDLHALREGLTAVSR